MCSVFISLLEISGAFDAESATLACGNIVGDFVIQVTDKSVRLVALSDLDTVASRYDRTWSGFNVFNVHDSVPTSFVPFLC